jgi:hypothetical protein
VYRQHWERIGLTCSGPILSTTNQSGGLPGCGGRYLVACRIECKRSPVPSAGTRTRFRDCVRNVTPHDLRGARTRRDVLQAVLRTHPARSVDLPPAPAYRECTRCAFVRCAPRLMVADAPIAGGARACATMDRTIVCSNVRLIAGREPDQRKAF